MTITVIGLPAPQGSKSFRGVSKAGHGIMVESSRHVKPWRDSVIVAAREVMIKGGLTAPAFRGPVNVCVTFSLPKPKSAQKRRASYPDRKPDIDKLLRSTFDGLSSAGVWEDDARVVSVCAYKVFAGEDELDVPRALIGIHEEL